MREGAGAVMMSSYANYMNVQVSDFYTSIMRDDDPWLSDEQQKAWRTYLGMTAALSERIERDLQRAAGMPHAYYLILAMLSEAPDRSMRMHQLAGLLQASQSRLSHAVSRLEEYGWVRREQARGDRRGGRAVLPGARPARLGEVAPRPPKTTRPP